MFEALFYSAIKEAEEKIDFKSLQFPIFRKHKATETTNEEWYCLNSLTKLISVRIDKTIIGIGISLDIPIETFVQVYSFSEPCSKEEFEKNLNYVRKIAKDELNDNS